jgi:CBS domain-containing protein
VNLVDVITAVAFQPIFADFDLDDTIDTIGAEMQRKVERLPVFQLDVKYLLGVSKESSRTFVYKSTQPISRLVEAFAWGVHRVLVEFPDENVVRFVSQTDVIKFITLHSETKEMQELLDKSLTQLGVVDPAHPRDIIHVNHKSAALTGYRRMTLNEELTALPVVDDKGRLVYALSASDLRGVTQATFKNILCPVRDFLKKTGTKRSVITASPDDKLRDVMAALAKHHVHRVYVIDKKHHPIGVVSQTDIIRLITPSNRYWLKGKPRYREAIQATAAASSSSSSSSSS